MSAKVITISDAEFEQTVLKSDKPVMLDFWAEWCQPCKMLSPTVEELAGDFEDQILVGKLNVDDNPNTATTYGIRVNSYSGESVLNELDWEQKEQSS